MLIALAVAAMIAGHPTKIECDVPPTAVISAWTSPDKQTIHMQAAICAGLEQRLGSSGFSAGMSALIHEAAHASGVNSESCAETWANVALFDVLWRFYAVPYFTALSEEVGRQVARLTRSRPPDYQPTPGACTQEAGAGKLEELRIERENATAARGAALERANSAAEAARAGGALAARSAGLNALYAH